MSAQLWRGALALCGVLSACGAPRSEPQAGGTSVLSGPCGRGLVVVESDYQSSNVSLVDFAGNVLAPSIASSSAENAGFGVALSGDVVVPGSAVAGAELVLLDRYPAGVLRFVDVASGKVTSELSVATGFRANPHDYLLIGPKKAYVTRYESNPNAGAQPWDGGGDVLIVDPSVPSITGRIELSSALAGENASFTPHPGRLLSVGKRVFAVLSAYDRTYMNSAVSRLVEVDAETDTLLSSLPLADLHGCDGLALSPDSRELAISCTGADLLDAPPSITSSGLALVDITGTPQITKTFAAATFGNNAIGFALDYSLPTRLVFGTLGYVTDAGSRSLDAILALDTGSGAFTEVVRSASQPFTLGDVRCAPSCGACFVADAERDGGSVLRFPLDAQGELGSFTAVRAETRVGLPPRYLGAF